MLQITIPGIELFDEEKQEFIPLKSQKLQLEHSLVSISKWESKWHKAFLTRREKTKEETIDYVRCMTITQNVDPSVYFRLSPENIEQINQYISAPMSAVYFPENKSQSRSGDTVTSELIYYWMISAGIPFECQKWHLNRLLALIRVCNMKNSPPTKRPTKDIMKQNAALNAARKAKLNTRG